MREPGRSRILSAQRRIEFGVQTNLHYTTYAEVLETWQTVEREGLDHAWTYDHFLPCFRDPAGPTLEGWTTLTALMMTVPRIRAGVLVPCNMFRHPVLSAKIATTLDQITGGERLEMAIGAGWWEPEFRAYGFPYPPLPERLDMMDEAIRVMQSLWTQERTTIEGKYYTITDAPFAPKPVQKPHLPLWIGGMGPKRTMRAVARYADGWNVWTQPREGYEMLLGALEKQCEEIGRDPATVRRSVAFRFAVDKDPKTAQARLFKEAEDADQELPEGFEELINLALTGSPDDITEQLSWYTERGVDHVILLLDAPFPQDELTRFAREVIPAVRAAGM